MLAAEQRAARARRSTWIAFALSLALHAGVLFLYLLVPDMRLVPGGAGAESDRAVRTPLTATLAKRAQRAQAETAIAPQTPPRAQRGAEPHSRDRGRILSSRNGSWRSNRAAQEAATPVAPARTPTAQELIRNTYAMIHGGLGREEDDQGADAASTQQTVSGKNIEPMYLQFYFDAFLKKLNSNAKHVSRPTGPQGQRKGLVEITIKPDGSVDYKVIRTADQAAEVKYIEDVLKVGGGRFAAFPENIRRETDHLTMRMCIVPIQDGVGAGFSRTYGGGSDCRD